MSTAVADGRCPICRDFIRYESKPLQAAPKIDREEFNRLVATLLKPYATDNAFLENALPACAVGIELPAVQQNGLYKTVLRFADQINDPRVVDFATMHARGY